MNRKARVVTGLEALLEDPTPIAGRRIGLVTNHAAVTSDFRHVTSLLRGDQRWTLVSLFGPEHGIWGEAQDMAEVGHSADRLTGLPVRSLYGKTFEELSPRDGDLDGLDTLVVDLQDVGSRYYTFVCTMALCMRVAARRGIRVVVLDRPNPLGGLAVEGNILALEYESFVGMYPLPVRHGMTAGELAFWFAAYDRLDLDLQVVPMRGWTRPMWWSDTGLPWVLPSPNMPTPDTATVYPGMCLVEGTNLSEGRGTTRPFEVWGAPWLEPFELAVDLNALELPGVVFRPHFFKPAFQKHAGTVCGGVQLHVTDRNTFEPYRTGLWCMKVARDHDPEVFAWRREVYEFVSDHPAIDLLTGDPAFRVIVDEEGDLDAWIREGRADARAFDVKRREWLLYE
ncbi:MAG: exo-beta-N-acetylmuramidase NamZ family protein [Thermoanaerobaculia bacterium]